MAEIIVNERQANNIPEIYMYILDTDLYVFHFPLLYTLHTPGKTYPLILFTSLRPRRLPIPGLDLNNVFMLRTPDDANAIAAASEGKKVVIVGSSFIGRVFRNYVSSLCI